MRFNGKKKDKVEKTENMKEKNEWNEIKSNQKQQVRSKKANQN